MAVTTMLPALAPGKLSLCATLLFFNVARNKSFALSTCAIAKQCRGAWLRLYLRASGAAPDPIAIPLQGARAVQGERQFRRHHPALRRQRRDAVGARRRGVIQCPAWRRAAPQFHDQH